MRRAMLALALSFLLISAHAPPLLPLVAAADDAEWKSSLTEGEFVGNRLCGVGSIISTEQYTDFQFEAKLTFDKASADQASFGFYFGIPPSQDNPTIGGVPFYQVIINQRDGAPAISLGDYHGPNTTGKRLWQYSLPKSLARMPGLLLTVQKKGRLLVIGLGAKRALGKINLERPDAGHLRLLIVHAPVTCEKISVKEM